MNVSQLSSGKYIIAVSGGIDSVVLLDYLHRTQPEIDLVVAHVDHGIRQDSEEDGKFVSELAKLYQLPYETKRAELGPEASEEVARNVRYDFLREVRQKYEAKGIITAHHANDVVETMIINIVRGTGWRGLCSLRSTNELYRPLLSVVKAEIQNYAQQKQLSWREDTTNTDRKYLRNEVRQSIMPHIDIGVWMKLYNQQVALLDDIDQEISRMVSRKRYDFIMWPEEVALEILRKEFNITRPQASRLLLGIKVGNIGNTIEISRGQVLTLTRDSFVV